MKISQLSDNEIKNISKHKINPPVGKLIMLQVDEMPAPWASVFHRILITFILLL